MAMMWVLLLGGLVTLFFGAEALVRGGSGLALRLGLSPLIIGLTIVAYGTSTPELVVSVVAGWEGRGDIAVGNAIGSNIFNIAAILGLTALICPMKVQFQLIRFDTPIMLLVAVVGAVCLLDRQLARGEALFFLVLLLAYTVANLRLARREATAEVAEEFAGSVKPSNDRWTRDLLLIGVGVGLLALGSNWLVAGAVGLARNWGISEAVIGLTIVSAGTSAPELATSLMAALRRAPDIAIGNIVGSNIYNIFGILGVSGALTPLAAPGLTNFDLGVMLGLSILLLPMIVWGRDLTRWEGGLLLALYGGYLWQVWPASAG